MEKNELSISELWYNSDGLQCTVTEVSKKGWGRKIFEEMATS